MPKEAKNNQELYEAIFKRKSVRSYDMSSLSDNILADVSAFIEQLEPLFPDCKIETRLVTGELVKSGVQKPAPHYVAIFAEKNDDNLLSIGFMFQQLSLYLTTRGLGSCWLGIPKPTKELLESRERDFVIFMSFGVAKENLLRENVSEFSRKAIEEIGEVEGMNDLMEPVRLAPSAINNQPWFFKGDEKGIHVYCNDAGFIKSFFIKKYNMMDIGICLSHLYLAALKKNKNISFYLDEKVKEDSPSGYYYVRSLKIE